MLRTLSRLVLGLAPVLLSAPAGAQIDLVGTVAKWTDSGGTLPAAPSAGDGYGAGLEAIGDLDGNGVTDVAVGLPGARGAEGEVWIQRLRPSSSVLSVTAIGEGRGGFSGTLEAGDEFGRSIANLGDIDGDGVVDLAVGAHGDDSAGFGRGAVYVLRMKADGTVKAQRKIADATGGLPAVLDNGDAFGLGLCGPGDLDGDGVEDLLAAAPFDDDGGTNHGAVYVLFLNADGSVKAHAKIGSLTPGFTGVLQAGDLFGIGAIVRIGDVDGDGLIEVAIGAAFDDGEETNRGALYLFELLPSGAIGGFVKIGDLSGGLQADLKNFEYFGCALDVLGDLDGNGVPDLLVGAYGHSERATNLEHGSLWVVYLDANGAVVGEEVIAAGRNGFGPLDTGDQFGLDVAVIDDLDANGVPEVVVAAVGDDDDDLDAGAAYVLSLTPCTTPASTTFRNAGSNPASYSATRPRLGRTWTAGVDLSTTGHALAVVVGFDSPFQFTLGGGQTLLAIDAGGRGELLGFALRSGPLATFEAVIPPESAYCGYQLSTQALHLGGVTPFALSNAQDLVLGL